MKICVYAIMKNEQQFYEKWLRSMWDNGKGADYICILDTGSDEGWREMLDATAKSVGIPDGVLIVNREVYNPWRFDTPRNKSMEMIPDDADICICTDLDEILISGWGTEFRKVAEENPGWGEIYYYYAWSSDKKTGAPKRYFWYNKCHRHPKFGVKWKYPVHETLSYSDEYKKKFPGSAYTDGSKIWLWHHPDDTKSRGSYLGLLELRAREDPNDIYGLFYLAREYTFRYMWAECVKWASYLICRINITKNDDMCMEPAAYTLLGDSYYALGMHKDAENAYRTCIEKYPGYREAYINLAQMCAYSNRPNEALLLLEKAEKDTVKYNDWRTVDWVWRKWKVNQIKADAMMWLGRYEDAELFMKEAEKDIISPDDVVEARVSGFYGDYDFLKAKLSEKSAAN